MFGQLTDGQCFLRLVTVIGIKHFLESPLCPMVVARFTGAHLTVPVEAKSDFVELFTISFDIGFSSDGGMLSSLYGVLFSRQSIGIISHGIEHVVSLLSFVSCIDVGCDISERVSHMQSSSRRIGKHIQHIEFLLALILSHLVGFLLHPLFLPFFLNLSEIVFHFSSN